MAKPSTGFGRVTFKDPLWAVETLNVAIAGTQTTGAGKATLLVGVAGEIVDVRAHLGTPSAGSSFIIDVNKNGTTIFTTQSARPTVLAAANASSHATPAVTAVAAGDRLSVDVDQIGSGTAGSDLYVAISIRRPAVAA